MEKKTSRVTVLLTAVYVILVVWIILFKMSTLSDIAYLDTLQRINLIPFYYDEEMPHHLSEVLNNVVIFVPLGVYFKMLRLSNRKAVLIGMGFSLSLEIFQFILAVGATDITDLITNTAGTAIGVCIYGLLSLIFRKRDKLDKVLCILASVCTVLFAALIALLLAGTQ